MRKRIENVTNFDQQVFGKLSINSSDICLNIFWEKYWLFPEKGRNNSKTSWNFSRNKYCREYLRGGVADVGEARGHAAVLRQNAYLPQSHPY